MSVMELDGAYNVRELGGLITSDGGRTCHRMLYRGDSLDAISARDEDLLFNRLHIGAVIDVRTQQEIAEASWRSSAVRYYNIPLISDKYIGTQPLTKISPDGLARAYLGDLRRGISSVRMTFEVLAAHLSAGIPCIVHCAAGRDRTGAIIAVLLAALGVRDEDIALDYVRSNVHADQVTQRLADNPLYANGQAEDGKPTMASADTVLVLLALLRRGYGTPAQFLIESGLTAATLRELEIALVEYPSAGLAGLAGLDA